MPHKERECYLGVTSQIGYLDRGAKWRRADWYAQKPSPQGPSSAAEERKLRLEKAKAEDKKRVNQALGLEKRDVEERVERVSGKEALEITKRMKAETSVAELRDEEVRVAGVGNAGRTPGGKLDLSKKFFKLGPKGEDKLEPKTEHRGQSKPLDVSERK